MWNAKLKIRKQQSNSDVVKKDIEGLCFYIALEMEKSEEICYTLRSWAPQDLMDYAGVRARLES